MMRLRQRYITKYPLLTKSVSRVALELVKVGLIYKLINSDLDRESTQKNVTMEWIQGHPKTVYLKETCPVYIVFKFD